MAKGNGEVWPRSHEGKVGIGRCVSQGRASLLPQAALVPAGLWVGTTRLRGAVEPGRWQSISTETSSSTGPMQPGAARLGDQAPGCAAPPGAHLAQGAQLCCFGHPAPLTCPQGGLQSRFPDSPRCQRDRAVSPATPSQPEPGHKARTWATGPQPRSSPLPELGFAFGFSSPRGMETQQF